MQASKLTGAWRSVPVTHYVEATEWLGESPMANLTPMPTSNSPSTPGKPPTTSGSGPDRVLSLIADV